MRFLEPRAHALLDEISKRIETRHLLPFGDGPFELQLAQDLKAVDPQDARPIVDLAAQLLLSRIVSPYAEAKDFRVFASLSFVARFADVPLTDGSAGTFIRALIDTAREDRDAGLALADYLRTLARTGVTVDVEQLPRFDPASDSPEILTAFAELLVTQRRSGAVELIGALLERGADVSGLLWNLAKEDHFIDELSRARWPLASDVRKEVEAALTEMDPSLEALDQWESKCLEPEEDDAGICRFSPYVRRS